MSKIFFCFFLLLGFDTCAQDCPDSCMYYMPNTLTPDCDDIDCEYLKIVSSCTFKKFDFTMYDRWGNIIFHSNDPKMKFDSEGHKDGAYLWKLKGEFCNAKIIDDTGLLYILR